MNKDKFNNIHPEKVANAEKKKRKFIKPQLIKHDQLHQIAKFGVSGASGLQTIGVSS